MGSLGVEALAWGTLLGGALALDGTSLGQTMASRPLVASTLAGALVGAPGSGAMLGLVLEALQLNTLPVGAARTPEAAPGAVAAGAVYASLPPTPLLLLSAVAFALLWERLGGETVHRLRQFNGRLARPESAGNTLAHRHLRSLAADGVRGALLTAAGLVLFAAAAPWLAPPELAAEWILPAVGAAVAACFGGVLALFGRERWRWFGAGTLLGALLLAAR